jgi:hypothetical protein
MQHWNSYKFRKNLLAFSLNTVYRGQTVVKNKLNMVLMAAFFLFEFDKKIN